MIRKIVNNWDAAKELERFKNRYLDPLDKKFEEAKSIIEDSTYPWKKNIKERAIERFKELDTEVIDFHRLYNAMFELIQQHEGATNVMTEIYSKWYHKVSYEGQQMSEMMSSQAEVLQELFQLLYNTIEPLKLDLKPPKK